MTERAPNADFRRKPLIFADSPLLLEIQAFGGRRKPQIFAGNRRFSRKTAGNHRLGSVTLSPSPLARPYIWHHWERSWGCQFRSVAPFGGLQLWDTLQLSEICPVLLGEALSGTTSEKRSVPSRTGGERILEMLWSLQMP